ncbi:unnamed protein product [Rhizoctonia solani]|uniref:DUF6535 domain-containing protein n=1 Tax=Rhizoctonia solani TaxID=456999 RepID=A0A8H3A1V2_9AGAM|nr:unnamed protein product [Rhizoctonia solani]
MWRLYQKEAKAQDRELVQSRDRNLDTMLLFAGLFSAVLTAFLVESTSLLEPDQANISISLLLSIAQSQQRMEAGVSSPTPSSITIPSFKPSNAARWINILWYLSLVLSLGAAMVAMLAKEWLSWFQLYKTRVPRKYALERQSRYEGLESWGAVVLIDFLPTVLHVSLLLFTLGLIIRLWIIDFVVASVVTAAASATALFYIGTVLLGALRELCPFKSRVSKYVRLLIKSCLPRTWRRGSRLTDEDERRYTSWNALRWFLDHARNPGEANEVYQSVVAADPSGSGSHLQALLPLAKLKENPRRYLSLLRLGSEAIKQLKRGKDKNSYNSIFWGGFDYNLARHAIVLSDIYPYATEPGLKKAIKSFTELKGSDEFTSVSSDIKQVAKSICEGAFEALAPYWQNEVPPPFVPNEYAGITIAGLKLASYAIKAYSPHRQKMKEGIVIEMQPERYSHWRQQFLVSLRRAALLIFYHLNHEATLENSSVLGLLVAMQYCRRYPINDLTLADSPDSASTNSSRLSVASVPIPPRPDIPSKVKIDGKIKTHTFNSSRIDAEYGLLAGLITLVGKIDLPEKLQIAAADAFVYAAPMVVGQWFIAQEIPRRARLGLKLWQPPEAQPATPTLAVGEHIVTQLTKFVDELGQHWKVPGIQGLTYYIIEAVHNRLEASGRADEIEDFIMDNPHLISGWIDWAVQFYTQGANKSAAEQNENKLKSASLVTYRIIFSMSKDKDVATLSSDSLPGLLQLVRFVCNHPPAMIGWDAVLIKSFSPAVRSIMVRQGTELLESREINEPLLATINILKASLDKIKGSDEGLARAASNRLNMRDITTEAAQTSRMGDAD